MRGFRENYLSFPTPNKWGNHSSWIFGVNLQIWEFSVEDLPKKKQSAMDSQTKYNFPRQALKRSVKNGLFKIRSAFGWHFQWVVLFLVSPRKKRSPLSLKNLAIISAVLLTKTVQSSRRKYCLLDFQLNSCRQYICTKETFFQISKRLLEDLKTLIGDCCVSKRNS